jgi:hypothetical protein
MNLVELTIRPLHPELTEGAMKSAFECFQHAAQCEQQAAAAVDPSSRTMLLHTAEHWRARGRAAQAKVDGGGKQTPGRPVRRVRRTTETLSTQLKKANKLMQKGAKVIIGLQQKIRRLQRQGKDTSEARKMLGDYHALQLNLLAEKIRLQAALKKTAMDN